MFLGASLDPVYDAIVTTRLARKLMLQNLWMAAIYNGVAVPIAVLGFVTPLIAALAMSGSSLLVTANALRGRLHESRTPAPAPQSAPIVQAQWSAP